MPQPKKNVIESIISIGRGLINAYPTPPYLSQISHDPPIFYRFGSYKLKNKSPSQKEFTSLFSERYTNELRELPGFSSIKPIEQHNQTNLDKLLMKYPIVAVLIQRGKGGVFIGIDFTSEYYKEVIIKVGYLHGEERRHGHDGFRLLKNEHLIINRIKNKINHIKIPQILDSSQSNSSYAIVLEKVEGENARNLLYKNNLTKAHIKKIISGISDIHKLGIIWGDAKIDNIIIDLSTNDIYFVDFETAFFSNGVLKKEDILTTYKLSCTQDFQSEISYDILHFISSVLFNQKTDNQKNIIIKDFIDRAYDNEVQNYCSEILQNMLV